MRRPGAADRTLIVTPTHKVMHPTVQTKLQGGRNPGAVDSRRGRRSAVEKVREQVRARMWAAGKMAPKKYGNATKLQFSGADAGSVTFRWIGENPGGTEGGENG